jgi:hypothetical protein
MYRSSVDGLAEQVRSLEEQRSRLEAELANVHRIVRPRRAWGIAVASLVLVALGFALGSLTAHHSLEALRKSYAAEQRAANQRIEMCNGRLAAALQSPRSP